MQDALASGGAIASRGDTAEPGGREDVRDRVGLMIADLEEDRAAIGEDGSRAGGGAAVEIQPVRAVGQRRARLKVTDAGSQFRHGGGGDVRRVGDDQVKPSRGDEFGRERQPVRDGGGQAVADAESSGVFLGYDDGCGTDIDAHAGRGGQLLQNADDDASAADAEFQDAGVRVGGAGAVVQDGFDEQFCLRSGDEDVGGDVEFEGEELASSGQISDRLGRRRPFDQLAEAGSLVVVGNAVEPGVKLDPAAPEDVGEEDFGAEAGVVDSSFGEEIAGRGEKPLDGPRRGEIGRGRH